MKYDELVECGRCGGNACYVQEVTKDVKIEQCFGCGFLTNSLMKRDTPFFFAQMQELPNLYKDLMVEDESTGKIWMPTLINIKDKGMVFADGTSKDSWAWAGVKAVKIKTAKDKIKYKGAKWRADMTTIKHFSEKDYMDALSYIGVIPG